jgi:hypothetical protein
MGNNVYIYVEIHMYEICSCQIQTQAEFVRPSRIFFCLKPYSTYREILVETIIFIQIYICTGIQILNDRM